MQLEENSDKLVEAIDKFIKAKKSLFLLSDIYTPCTALSNLITQRLFDGMYVEGVHLGVNIVCGDDFYDKTGRINLHSKNKFDYNHLIADDLNNLHEGLTICHPVNLHPDFRIFAYNSKNEPLVLYAEENENHGRILMNFGFTKLYPEL